MRVYQGRGLGDFYYSLLRDVTNHGRKVTVRGQDRLEMREPVAIVYQKPGHCWMNIKNRRFNPFFALAEVYWILSGNGSAEWIGYYNKRMLTFRDGENDQLHGAYGTRIRRWPVPMETLDPGIDRSGPLDQVQHVVRKLAADPFSTQAVVSLWDPIRDNLIASKDIPCNNQVNYQLRDGLLNQIVVIRSNDVVWGTPYNAVQFSHLHALVAGMLGVQIGTLTYVIENLHYYFDLYKDTLANLLEKAFDDPTQSGPGALVIPNFDTVDQEGIELLGYNIDRTYEMWNSLMWCSLKGLPFKGNGYWNQTIPQVLWIYRILKEGVEIEEGDKEYMASCILALGTPLAELIVDFLGESIQPLQKEVVEICQKMSQSLSNR